MAIHLYKDPSLTDQVSEGGSLSNPDSDSYNGTTGETKDKQLYVANEQTTVAVGVDASVTTLTVADARFQNNEAIIIEGEQMLITAGGGSTTLTVQRGYNGTTAASHNPGLPVYSAYNYTSLVVQPVDTEMSGDETAWVLLALSQSGLDAATPGATLTLGDKQYFETATFWRRVVVPAATPVQNKTDLRLRLAGIENPVV